MAHLLGQAEQAESALNQRQGAQQHPAYAALLNSPSEIRTRLSEGLSDLLRKIDSMNNHLHGQVAEAARQILGDHDRVWRELLDNTIAHVDAIGERAQWADETPISGLDGRDRSSVKEDARELLAHLQAGGGWGVRLLRAKVVKRAFYFRSEVRIGGRLCDNPGALQELISWLDVEDRLRALRQLWEPLARAGSSRPATQVAEYRDFCEALKAALELYQKVAHLRTLIHDLPNVAEPKWHEPEAVRGLLAAVRAAEHQIALVRANRTLREISEALTPLIQASRADPAMQRLFSALHERDWDAYARAHADIRKNFATRQALDRRRGLMRRLEGAAPELARSIAASADDPI